MNRLGINLAFLLITGLVAALLGILGIILWLACFEKTAARLWAGAAQILDLCVK